MKRLAEQCLIPFKLCVDLLVHFGMEPWRMPSYSVFLLERHLGSSEDHQSRSF